ncbi:uncharacterized protein K02A2.6-like [Bacillus rossius redtenbacheri]|uniref:uncharacterized protein K02A2.6-like n=1 Tax=Bacillus rossius redtenbacheri TaxID=93214 RepID=UPI002FDCAEBB
MESFKPPPALLLDGNLCEHFRQFKQSFDIFMLATGYESKPSAVKAAMWLNLIGDEAVELFNTFDLPAEDRRDFEKVLRAFEHYCNPVKNIVVERYKFNCRSQEEGEPFDSFVRDLKKLVQSCDFKNQTDSVVRDRIVLGIRDKGLQERLLREPDLSLSRAMEQCRVAELGKQRADAIQTKAVNPVNRREDSSDDEIHPRGGTVETVWRNRRKQKSTEQQQVPYKRGAEQKHVQQGSPKCRRCGRVHRKNECPAFGKKCYKCMKFNHFATVCTNQVEEVRLTGGEMEEFFVSTLEVAEATTGVEDAKPGRKEWIQEMWVEGKTVYFKLDTGSEVNIISQSIVKQLARPTQLKWSHITLKGFGGKKVKPVGVIKLMCGVNTADGAQECLEFVVVEDGSCRMPILGLPGCVCLKLVSRSFVHTLHSSVLSEDKFLSEFADVFQGVGCIPNKCTLVVDKSVQPVAKPPRRVPFALRDGLKIKLDELVKLGIIAKVDQPTGWVSNLTVVEKGDKSLRLCLDPVDLNKAICREYHMIPSLEELSCQLNNKSIFTVLDLKDGFYQVELDEESSMYCTFSTPFGFYKFLRLPFGLSSAPEIFQRINMQNFGDIPGVLVYFDDLLIAAANEVEHDQILLQVAQRARALNVKFNVRKIQFKKEEARYFGHVFSSNGMQPDPDQVRAILALQTPTNKVELQRVLGFISYLRKFLPNLASIIAPLRELLKNDTEWQWLPVHTDVLQQVKELVSKAPVLGLYDPNKKLSIQLQRMKIRLLRYTLSVEYLPGKLMHVADLLSRAYLPEVEHADEDLSAEMVHLVSDGQHVRRNSHHLRPSSLAPELHRRRSSLDSDDEFRGFPAEDEAGGESQGAGSRVRQGECPPALMSGKEKVNVSRRTKSGREVKVPARYKD